MMLKNKSKTIDIIQIVFTDKAEKYINDNDINNKFYADGNLDNPYMPIKIYDESGNEYTLDNFVHYIYELSNKKGE